MKGMMRVMSVVAMFAAATGGHAADAPSRDVETSLVAKQAAANEMCPSASFPDSVKAVTDALDSGSYVMLSAGENPKGKEKVSESHIQLRSRCLEADLHALGFCFGSAQGHYDSKPEESFFVLAKPAQQPTLIYLGERYDQESVIVGNNGSHALVFTTGKHAKKAEIVSRWSRGASTKEGGHTAIKALNGEELRFKMPFTSSASNGPFVDYLDAERALDPSFDPLKGIRRAPECAALVSDRSTEQMKRANAVGH